MPTRDLHDRPFDEGTKTKLVIYRHYIRAWLQVFLHATKYEGKPLQFFDFLCGPGRDSNGEPGSPLILLEELFKERGAIAQRGHGVRIFFNDKETDKIAELKRHCEEPGCPWLPRFESLEFSEAFSKVRDEFDAGPTLVFVDQNGLRQITRPVFEVLARADTTDFLFFTASSFAWRFGDLLAPEIEFPNNVSYLEVHRLLADHYRKWAPRHVLIGHFAIRKGSNIYGLIFGSHHWRGLLKFLEIVWKLDEECGEANYELEQDTTQGVMDFDQGITGFKKRKIEAFQDRLDQLISSKALKSDDAVFQFCLVNGFLPRVAKGVYTRLRESGLLKNSRANFPRCSPDAMKEPRKFEI